MVQHCSETHSFGPCFSAYSCMYGVFLGSRIDRSACLDQMVACTCFGKITWIYLHARWSARQPTRIVFGSQIPDLLCSFRFTFPSPLSLLHIFLVLIFHPPVLSRYLHVTYRLALVTGVLIPTTDIRKQTGNRILLSDDIFAMNRPIK
jgi:hypothetical protein